MNKIQEISNSISSSKLLANEQREFLKILSDNVDNQQLETLFNLFQEDPSWIEKIWENYCQKRKTFKNNNSKAWDNIMLEEESLLSDQQAIDKLNEKLNQS